MYPVRKLALKRVQVDIDKPSIAAELLDLRRHKRPLADLVLGTLGLLVILQLLIQCLHDQGCNLGWVCSVAFFLVLIELAAEFHDDRCVKIAKLVVELLCLVLALEGPVDGS